MTRFSVSFVSKENSKSFLSVKGVFGLPSTRPPSVPILNCKLARLTSHRFNDLGKASKTQVVKFVHLTEWYLGKWNSKCKKINEYVVTKLKQTITEVWLNMIHLSYRWIMNIIHIKIMCPNSMHTKMVCYAQQNEHLVAKKLTDKFSDCVFWQLPFWRKKLASCKLQSFVSHRWLQV